MFTLTLFREPTRRCAALSFVTRAYRSIVLLSALSAATLFAQPLPPTVQQDEQPAVQPHEQTQPASRAPQPCSDCGTVRSIREVRTERRNARPDVYVTSPQYLETRPADPPVIGPALSLTWRKGEQPQPKIGAIGSPNSPVRFVGITYEVLVQFEDGRFALIEQEDASNLRVGDRVRAVNRRVELFRE